MGKGGRGRGGGDDREKSREKFAAVHRCARIPGSRSEGEVVEARGIKGGKGEEGIRERAESEEEKEI